MKPRPPAIPHPPAARQHGTAAKTDTNEPDNTEIATLETISEEQLSAWHKLFEAGLPVPEKVRPKPKLPLTPIVFVGPMAAGKTTIGKQLAKNLGIPFVDTDTCFEREKGSITEFFEQHGEQEFRRIEKEIVYHQLCKDGPRVVSLGGGAVLDDEMRRVLMRHHVIFLKTNLQQVLRNANLERRPLLRDNPESWQRIYDERKKLYKQVARLTVDTARLGRARTLQHVYRWVEQQGITGCKNRGEL